MHGLPDDTLVDADVGLWMELGYTDDQGWLSVWCVQPYTDNKGLCSE